MRAWLFALLNTSNTSNLWMLIMNEAWFLYFARKIFNPADFNQFKRIYVAETMIFVSRVGAAEYDSQSGY